MLAGFDDRMLADIGLTRSDVRDAFAEPLWQDPTDLLRTRALERRRAATHSSLGPADAGAGAAARADRRTVSAQDGPARALHGVTSEGFPIGRSSHRPTHPALRPLAGSDAAPAGRPGGRFLVRQPFALPGAEKPAPTVALALA